MRGVMVCGEGGTFFAHIRRGYFGNGTYAYIRLAELYQQLGRPDAVAAIAVKIRTVASSRVVAKPATDKILGVPNCYLITI